VRRSEHPAANRDGYVLEHRLTVEAILQRYLLSGEQIHHLNFVKADNDIENLVLFPSAATHTNFHKYMERVAVGLLGIAPMPAPFSIAAPIFYKQRVGHRDRLAYYAPRLAIVFQIPGVPAVVHTHPGVPAAAGAVFHRLSPTAHVPVVGAAVP
jgi:hypothetical protein